MNKGKGLLIILMVLLFGTATAQINGINKYSENQTDYNTMIESMLFTSQAKTLSDCNPVEANKKGTFRFDTNGTGCPSGLFEINEAELLLKIVSTNNRIDNISVEGGVSDGNVYSIGIISSDTNAFIIDLNATEDVNFSGLSHPKDTNILYIGTDPHNLGCIDNNGTSLLIRFGGC